ncbi:hypothetical protein Tco_0721168 [Tanacetum coccineum]
MYEGNKAAKKKKKPNMEARLEGIDDSFRMFVQGFNTNYGTMANVVANSMNDDNMRQKSLLKYMKEMYTLCCFVYEIKSSDDIAYYWEVYGEGQIKYWKIVRVGDHTKVYQLFEEMLRKFDREDLDKLWSLVKETFSTTDPTEDKEKMLWVELKRLYEPDPRDQLWALQKYMHDPLEWKLYDMWCSSCIYWKGT